LVANEKPFRVLSLDGGGIRGSYTATYLDRLAMGFAARRGLGKIDVGRAFDLIVGTSTGGIIACALAAGIELPCIVGLYRDHGPAIFPRRLPDRIGIRLCCDFIFRPSALRAGTAALRLALVKQFKEETLGELYARRGIAIAVPAVELSQHHSWVFKTPHLGVTTSHRDDNYRLVDVCLATTAAPVYRSLAVLDHPDRGKEASGHNVFADGGLWANNPVLVGLIDALEMTKPGQAIEIFCLGTCSRPAGEQVDKLRVHRGLVQWKFGADAAGLSIDAQEFAYDNMARMIARHVDRKCEVVRFPRCQIPAALIPHLGLDDTRPNAIDALINQARTDADVTNSQCGDSNSREGRMISQLFFDAPGKPP
jgi:hypothetical protein